MTRRRTSTAVAVRTAAAPDPVPVVGRPVITQPTSRIMWPWEPATGMPLVWDPWSAIRIPGVSKALQVYTTMIKQCALDAFRGITPLPRPRLLDQPDPNQSRPWFVQVNIEDYCLNGNAVHYITAFDATGWPAAVQWLPAAWLSIACPPRQYGAPVIMLDGFALDPSRIVHVKRGADRWCPARGVGIVEQHLPTLDRAAMEEQYERDALRNGAVPSVAIITPNPRLGEDEATQAKVDWLNRFAGPGRQPAVLPAGTQVIPLAWSPEDAQLQQARQMSLLDIANMFGLDGYWLGAPGGSMTYRSPGSMYTNLLRTALEGVLADLEAVWGQAWLPRGQSVRFDRLQLTRDDLQTMVAVLVQATGADPPLMTQAEARAMIGLPPFPTDLVTTSPLGNEVPAPAPAP